MKYALEQNIGAAIYWKCSWNISATSSMPTPVNPRHGSGDVQVSYWGAIRV